MLQVREIIRLRLNAELVTLSACDSGVGKLQGQEPSWLPAEVIGQLGRAKPVIVDELSDAETEELRQAAPQLRALLADNHPARQVARNLFRLSRLASLPSDAPVVRTEAEMAEQWWETADGQKDENHRDRARVLRTLAEQALTSAGTLDVSGFPTLAVDALVASQTLRDLGNDRVTFRHDVLREWGNRQCPHR